MTNDSDFEYILLLYMCKYALLIFQTDIFNFIFCACESFGRATTGALICRRRLVGFYRTLFRFQPYVFHNIYTHIYKLHLRLMYDF